jgi:hypothetical protein
MTLTISNEAVYRDIEKLAALTGLSMTAAVGEAVAKRLAEIGMDSEAPSRKAKFHELMRIAEECARELKESGISSDHSFLYDEHGLPK